MFSCLDKYTFINTKFKKKLENYDFDLTVSWQYIKDDPLGCSVEGLVMLARVIK